MWERELSDGVRVIRIETPDQAKRHRSGFIGAYQTIFAGAPYFERFSPAEAEGVWKKITRTPGNISLLAIDKAERVLAFGMAVPLANSAGVARQLAGLVNIQRTFYLAELGVLPRWRRKQLGRTLVQERMNLIDPVRWDGVVLRVAAQRNASYDMYRSMGFDDMGVYMEVPGLRTTGRVTTDRRLFLYQQLSAVSGELNMPPKNGESGTAH